MRKTKFSHKVMAIFLVLTFMPSMFPVNYLFASNNGPNAPEAASFEPVDATDMVNLLSGDVSYVLPLMDMQGFPLTLSYHAGVPLDMESSWTGLGWNVNAGAISRSVSGTPDDWNDGKSLDFIYFQDSEEFYNINVGVGISQAAEVGVGISWGSNKSLSGSVYGSFMFVNASIATDGAYSAGVGLSAGGGNFGGSLGIGVSGNVNGGPTSTNIGVGLGHSSGARASLGYSISESGGSFSFSGGYANNTAFDKGQAGAGGGLSLGSYSSGDYDIDSKGFFIPVQIWIFNLSFGYRKVTYKLDKAYPKLGYGGLYANNAFGNTPDMDLGGDAFNDFQNRYRYTDMYEEAIPAKEEEFVEDYAQEREKVNFSFASYDSYSVNAAGISGLVQPKLFENATLYGLGYAGDDTDDASRNMRVYYHNADSSGKTFGTSTTDGPNDIKFYFNGQFTDNVATPSRLLTAGAANDFGDYLSATNANIGRQRSGNFVEVFTNQQLADGTTVKIARPHNADYANWPADGIGAYKITAPDGKTYHYSLPVYHYEHVERNLLKDNSQNHVNEKRQYTEYATHWLLTAITGPDYVDVDNDNKVDDDDYGYWISLEHGKWSDGYVWRSPYGGKKYNTNLAGDIETKDFGNYQFGRKQLYYLDKIVSRSHTAYFVKDLRYDSTGAHGTNELSSTNQTTYNYTFSTDFVENDITGNPERVGENLSYKREYQLMLDKIVIVPNENVQVNRNENAALALDDGSCFPGYDDDTNNWNPMFNSAGGFAGAYGTSYRYDLHQESNVYDITDFENYDYANAQKVIDFSYNYSLARNTPSSLFCEAYGGGKLTLTGVAFRGKGDYGYMPPYRFAYKNEMDYPAGLRTQKFTETNYQIDQAKDGWGFINEKEVAEQIYGSTDYEKYGPDNWSLTEITTPTGGKIKLEYEEDDYEQEAFSRKLWQSNLNISFAQADFNCNNSSSICEYEVYIENSQDLRSELIVDFNEFFEIGQRVFFDFSLCFMQGSNQLGSIDIPGGFDAGFIVKDIRNIGGQQNLILSTSFQNINNEFFSNTNDWRVVYNEIPYQPTHSFLKFDKSSSQFISRPRGECPSVSGNQFGFSMNYKLLANKVPKDIQGGGLRAKSIIVSDENGREYKTKYYYNNPGTAREKNDPNYVSSGITSFAPESGVKYVPYQSELPSPGVMYEYVTMVPESTNGNELGSTRYRFHTLDAVFNIFDPNLKLKYMSEKVNQATGQVEDEEITIFESNVNDPGNGDYFDTANKTYAKSIDLKVNTSLVGQFRSIETFNVENHLMSKTQKFYKSGEEAKAITGRGSVTESFQSMKSIFSTDGNDANPVLKNRLVSVSTKEDYTSVVSEVRTTIGGFIDTEVYEDADPQTGAFRVTKTKRADGTEVRTRQVPAYTEYTDMGSKADNINNKHMLTQTAMTISDVNMTSGWQTIAASVNTWSPRTFYDDSDVLTDDNIWRKHQTFIWKDDVAADGTFGSLINGGDFSWGYGDSQPNTQWQKISETTRYNHWSSPLEVKDINDNYLATKMGDNNEKVFATGNAGYKELFYSGAEDLDGSVFGGEVGLGTATHETNLSNVHSGKASLEIGSGQTGYLVSVTEGKRNNYKASLWAKFAGHQNVRLQIDSGAPISFNTNEIVRAGEWVQLNFYFDINGQQTVNVTSENGAAFVDDFRLHPVASTMTSYVYNEWDELTHILGGNNMSTRYEYDQAGRLSKTYTEVEDFNGPGSGGFKRISENKYSYKYQ
ncbi:hypothetical protein FEE95_20925 [Maribacter algarum]|uniref:RHS repeat-associated core domain-containing protein n=1 Tax=Maribacter algarum (ex Zhang et al. 2020) TaxID=2578118 RepID=A0A5S3PJ78_9FLAO|nr:hypothetical protein [Maribacter algarum]TMM52154.1 hypothetical protein FEE95_20925 [Maribacter algarum]